MSIGQEISFRKISLGHLEMKFPFDNLDQEVTESENRLVLKTQLSNSRYKVEHTYRLMKSGMGVDSVYVRTSKRADALLFVVAIATLVSSIIDALLRRHGTCPYPTAKKAAETVQHVMFTFHRDRGEITVVGPEGSANRVFAYIDGIGLDPSILFEK